MPPKNSRKAPTARATQTQGTLAFGAQNKITKPSTATASRSTTKKPTTTTTNPTANKPLSTPAVATVINAISTPSPPPESPENDPPPTTTTTTTALKNPDNAYTTNNLTLRPNPPTYYSSSSSPSLDALELTALALPQSQIKAYWAAKEASRLHPRVHQSGLSLHEKILREFDLTSAYGPCIGIGRLKRWKRAESLGLRPPVEVLGVLMREREAAGGKERGWERAAMEGLVGGGSG